MVGAVSVRPSYREQVRRERLEAEFERERRRDRRWWRGILAAAVVWTVICLAAFGAAVFVALHFIGKYW